jgi:hypothetical protein
LLIFQRVQFVVIRKLVVVVTRFGLDDPPVRVIFPEYFGLGNAGFINDVDFRQIRNR